MTFRQGFRLFSLVIGLILTIVSCGEKPRNSRSQSEANLFLGPEAFNCTNEVDVSAEQIMIHGLSQKFSRIMGPMIESALIQRRTFDLKNPMRVNDQILKSELETLEKRFADALGAEAFGQLSQNRIIIISDNEKMKQIRELENELTRISLAESRWSDRKCLLNEVNGERKWDVLTTRAYLALQADYLNFGQIDFLEQLSLCEFFHTTPICISEHKIQTKQNRYHAVARGYQKKINELKDDKFHKSLFKRKLNCSTEADRKILNIAVEIDSELLLHNTLIDDSILAKVSEKWTSDQLEVKLVQADQLPSVHSFYKVKIKYTDKKISHVINGQNVINLGARLSGDHLIKILTHEIGHVFGIPDCYVEFFDPKTKQLVYFELGEQGDIMCSFDGNSFVPERAKAHLKDSCLTSP